MSGGEAARIEDRGEGDQRRAADADDDVADDEHLQPAAVDVLAHRGSGHLVVADRPRYMQPGRMPGALEQDIDDHGCKIATTLR